MVRELKLGIERQAVPVRTADGLDLICWLWDKPGRTKLTIVSPGFAQHHGTPIMKHVAQELWLERDVLGVDYRGMARNPGRYGFGYAEQQDLHAALDWARQKHYTDVEVIGFSMGAYIALRALAEDPGPAKRLFFVSGPTVLEEILTTLGPLRQLWFILTHPHHLKLRVWGGSQWFFRWDWPLKAKPYGPILAGQLTVPVAFLVGGEDNLVLPRLTKAVYEGVRSLRTWTEFPEGAHAEYMAVTEKPKFLAWMAQARKALGGRAKNEGKERRTKAR